MAKILFLRILLVVLTLVQLLLSMDVHSISEIEKNHSTVSKSIDKNSPVLDSYTETSSVESGCEHCCHCHSTAKSTLTGLIDFSVILTNDNLHKYNRYFNAIFYTLYLEPPILKQVF